MSGVFLTTVFRVSSPTFKSTRLYLAGTAWGYAVRTKLAHMGFTVESTEELACPGLRGASELARRDELLNMTGL
jgi:hypothetical protein